MRERSPRQVLEDVALCAQEFHFWVGHKRGEWNRPGWYWFNRVSEAEKRVLRRLRSEDIRTSCLRPELFLP